MTSARDRGESGADAIMLPAETASGAHPVETVEMMDRAPTLTALRV